MSTGKPQGGSQILRMVIAFILGIVGLVTLLFGQAALNSNDLPTALLYFSITVLSLGFVSFSVLRVRRGYSFSSLSNNRIMSIVLCSKCTFKQIKNFALGDYVFKQEGKCSQCGNTTLFISGIFSDDLKKR